MLAVSLTAPNGLAIHAVGLTKRYGNSNALSGLSLNVPRGAIFGLLGPNGAGKTTAMKLFLGLARPSSGRADVLGAPAGAARTRRRIGYLPEFFRYQSWLTVREVLAVHCEFARLPHARWDVEIRDSLRTVDLSRRADDRVEELSKGLQQRLGLAVALLGAPDLLLLDEPTSALDPAGRREVRDLIGTLKHRGATVLLNSHLLGEVERVCDSVLFLDRGKMIASGGLNELLGTEVVRLEVGDVEAARTVLRRFGDVDDDGRWLVVRGVGRERVPELVAAVVHAGGRVYAVEPQRESLEARYLRLLAEGEWRH